MEVNELVGNCMQCKKEIYCMDGFLNGIVVEKGNILCFECQDQDEGTN